MARCSNCGASGHKAPSCPDSVTCSICGKRGYSSRTCPNRK